MLWHRYQRFQRLGQEVLQGFVKYVADTTESYFDQFEQVASNCVSSEKTSKNTKNLQERG